MRFYTATKRLLPIFFLTFLAPLLYAQSDDEIFPPKPEPAVYVHDYSGWLGSGEKATLEEKLRRYKDSTSTQIVVMIRPDLGGYDKASYAFELGNRWGIGRKDKNNGVVVLVKSEAPDRGIFIATGYGTEGALPDITAGLIIRNTMAPYFRQQQYYQGIDAGVNDIIKALGGEFVNDQPSEVNGEFIVILLIVFLILFAIIGFAFYRVWKDKGNMYTIDGKKVSRRRRGDIGGGWWMGGMGGGGWGSGGSSGGWGGGSDGGSFGGGSFGGGGAGGDW